SNVSYSWTTSGTGTILSGANNSSALAGSVGQYEVTVTDNTNGCSSTQTVTVTQANVTASFTANPVSGLSPLDVNFTDGSSGSGSMNYNWDFGDSNTSTAQNPNHTYTTGSYTVILTVSSGPCVATATTVITVEDGLTLEVPNVFTPNGDGSNDIFTIKSTGVKEISLQIFNRWGLKLYEFAGPNASWDGSTTHGNKVPEGTYFFFVKATGFDGKEIQKNGTVNLFR
ncbi:MAG: gliding motility-associated C-terminal domain-containing protein, partial [Bacteroidetes bacterium]|nr:gliding motility-associated C-terminal domain-containing protein [Bacteroidota bacterium]